MDQQLWLPVGLQGLLEPDAVISRLSGSEGGAAQRCAAPTRQIESAFYALRHTLLTGHVLRSGDPVGLEQELWALLTLYQSLRMAIVAAVESRPGTDPDRACFTTALETARDQLTAAHNILPDDRIDLVGDIGRAVLARLLPPRRPRISVRKVKSPISRYHTYTADDRPLTSQNITHLAIAVHQPNGVLPSVAARRHQSGKPTGSGTDHTPTPGRLERILALLASDPARSWHGNEIAQHLDTTKINSLCVQLSRWAASGLIRKTGRAQYSLAPIPSGP